ETMFNHTHSLSVEGGVDDVRIGLDARYSSQNGVMKDSKRDNMSAGVTIDYRTKKLQIKNNASFGVVKSQNSPYGNFSTYTNLKPYYELYDNNTGELTKQFDWISGVSAQLNPLWNVQNTKSYDRSEYVEFANNLALNYFFTDQIYIKGTFSISRKVEDGDKFKDPNDSSYGDKHSIGTSGELFGRGQLNTSTRTTDRWNAKFYGVFNKSWNEDHSLMSSAGFDINGNTAKYESSTYKGFPNGDRTSPGWAHEQSERSYSDAKTHLIGGFLTANYTYKDTYMADVSIRMDGSSEFGTDKKWGIFWSVGAGVNLHKMEFLSDYTNLDILKVRANVGKTGKTGFQPYAAEDTYSIDNSDWYMTGIGATLQYMGNPNLSWESATTYNIGFDLTMFQNRFDISFDYYYKLTQDLVTEMSLPTSSGFSRYTENIGEVVNKGFEIDLGVNIYRTRDFSLDFGINLAHNDNKLTKVSNALARYNERIDEYYKQEKNSWAGQPTVNEFDMVSTYLKQNSAYTKPYMKYEEGQSLTGITAMQSLGINPADGKEVIVRRDGSLTTVWDPSEQSRVGDTEPEASGSFRVSARYKNWSLFTTFLYEFGGDAYNSTLVNNIENIDLLYNNVDRRVLSDRWYTPGQEARFKSINARTALTKPTERMVQKNNYVKFNSLQLSYEFDREKLRNIGLRQLKLSLSMQDVAQWSTVKREMGTSYPFARTFSLVLNTSF
ncbi:MAG: SusC/RagA family TonB-linked outer membrane protein, partial [Rikenellaceae bacterium]|nr:SusC/RagA family TonB-linked outer membrane protein [Rikenellaceae bacterium]